MFLFRQKEEYTPLKRNKEDCLYDVSEVWGLSFLTGEYFLCIKPPLDFRRVSFVSVLQE